MKVPGCERHSPERSPDGRAVLFIVFACSLLAGCAVAVVWHAYPQLQWQQIDPGIYALVANVIALVAVSLATQPPDEEHVRQFVVT